MKLVMKKAGEYSVLTESGVEVWDILKVRVKLDRPIRTRSVMLHFKDHWTLKRSAETWEKKPKFRSLEQLLKVNFPAGFTNRPGPLRVLDRAYGSL